MPSFLSRLPNDDGGRLDYHELRRWLLELQDEIDFLRRRLDEADAPAVDGPFGVTATEINMTTPGRARFNASQMQFNAASFNVNSPMSTFSGVIKCDTIIATNVIGSSYTPGAGNIW